MGKNPLRSVTARETAVKLAVWKEQDIGAEITLAETRVADQLGRRFTLEELHQTLAKLKSAAFTTVWTAAHHHVTCRQGLGHTLKRSCLKSFS